MKNLFLFIALLFITTAHASDSLQITLNKKKFIKGDTLEFKCVVPDFAALKLTNATLNVWIDDLEQHKRWKYRYPMINGEVSATLAISDKIMDGKYAVNFLVQSGFFRVLGAIRDPFKNDTLLNYMMISKNNASTYMSNTHVERNGSFRLKSALFVDSAYFIFSPPKKTNNNYYFIDIETPLDSAFTPVLQKRDFITVGDPKMLGAKKTDTTVYSFSVDDPQPGMLPGVTVTSKFKTKVEQFNDEYSRGLFDDPQARIFDGLESQEIARSQSVLRFLIGRVPGMDVRSSNGIDHAIWHGRGVKIYLDEFPLPAGEQMMIFPSDVAMIKVYDPPSHVGGDFSNTSGIIAIYTKKGKYIDSVGRTRHRFVVKGYTNLESIWE